MKSRLILSNVLAGFSGNLIFTILVLVLIYYLSKPLISKSNEILKKAENETIRAKLILDKIDSYFLSNKNTGLLP